MRPEPDAMFFPVHLVCSGCDRIDFFMNAIAHGLTDFPSDAIGFDRYEVAEWFIYFAQGDIGTSGYYTSLPISYPATLRVTVVPEPNTFWLLVPAITAVSIARRRACRIGLGVAS